MPDEIHEEIQPCHWQVAQVTPAALVPLQQFLVNTELSRRQLLARLARSANDFFQGTQVIAGGWRKAFLNCYTPAGIQIVDQPPQTPMQMVMFGLDYPRPNDNAIHEAIRRQVDPATFQVYDAERTRRMANKRSRANAKAVVAGIYQLGFRPATLCELLTLAMYHNLDPQPGLPGWGGRVNSFIDLHALGSCEKQSSWSWCNGEGGGLTEYVHPIVHIGRMVAGGPFGYSLELTKSENSNYGTMRFGQDFFLAVRVNQ